MYAFTVHARDDVNKVQAKNSANCSNTVNICEYSAAKLQRDRAQHCYEEVV